MSEIPAVVYLEADDEITSVVRRVRAAEAERVIVVVPGRSRATSSAIALRLLARTGEEEGREVAVVGDALTRSLATEAGLAAYAMLEDARRAEPGATSEPTEVHHAAIHVVRGTDETVATPALVADETVATPALVADEVTRAVPVARPPAERSRRRPIVVAVAAVLAIILVLGLAGAAVLPGATVTIDPVTEAVGPAPYVIEVAQPEQLSGTAEETVTVTATGEYEILEPAAGDVVLFNWSAVGQAIAAGTLVAAGDQAFETQDDVVVGRGSLTPEGTIQAGEATVRVVAAAAGPAGSVGAMAIDTVLSQDADVRLQGFPENGEPRVTNPEATSGGVDEAGVRFTRADVDAAVEALTANLRDQAANAVPERPDVILVQADLAEPMIEGADDLAGTRDQPEASIEGTLAWEAWTVDRASVTEAARSRLVGDGNVVPDGHALLPDSIEVMVEGATFEGQVLVIDVTATGLSTAQIDTDQVIERIGGLSPGEAEAALADLGDATVDLWPDWVASVPSMEWRIVVRVGEP